MTFLAPGFLFASLAVAGAVVALHLIVTRQPRAAILPTARFVPDLPATATARTTRPSDFLLMLLRVFLVLCAGAGLARPVPRSSRSPRAAVILVDRSRSVGDVAALRDSARRHYRKGDAVVLFDSAARFVTSADDSLAGLTVSRGRGSMSGALIAALRAGSLLRERADSVGLVIVSPLDSEEIDAATDSIRQLWTGKALLVHAGFAAATAKPQAGRLEIKTRRDDPLAVAVARVGTAATANTRLVRDSVSVEDVSWAGGGDRVLVEWPIQARPRGAAPAKPRDSVGGVVAGSSVVVANFSRRWKYAPDSIRGAQVVARWIDGEPAAVEWPQQSGCVRSAAVSVDPVGDLPLRTSFIQLVSALSGPCIAGRGGRSMSQAALASLTGQGGLVSRDAFLPRPDVRSRLAPWLLALALIAAVGELFVRRRRDGAIVAERAERVMTGKAA